MSEQQGLPPFDDEAERIVLGAYFFDAEFRRQWRPDPDLFLSRPHRLMAEIMAARHGQDLDEDQLVLELARARLLDKVGGAEAVHAAVTGSRFVTEPHRWVERLVEFKGLKRLRKALQSALQKADARVALTELQGELSEALRASTVASGANVTGFREALGREAIAMQSPIDQSGRAYTRIDKLDQSTGGLQPEFVWLVGGMTSWGKTTFLVYLVDGWIQAGHRPLITYNEDSVSLYARRFLASRGRAAAWRLREHNLRPEERDRVLDAANKAQDQPAFLNGRGRTVEAIAADVRALVQTDGIDIVCLDYIQKIQTSKQFGGNRVRELAYAFDVLTAAIKEAGASGVIMSQLTGVERGKRPIRENIRDCRDMAHGAEAILLGWEDSEGRKKLYVDKTKDGPTNFDIDLRWNKVTASFEEVPDETRSTAYDYVDEYHDFDAA